jgi:hypothetical protein
MYVFKGRLFYIETLLDYKQYRIPLYPPLPHVYQVTFVANGHLHNFFSLLKQLAIVSLF